VSAFSQGHAWVQENSPPFVAAGVGA